MEFDFKKAEKLADYIYNTSVVLEYYCMHQRKYESLYNISPVVKSILDKADILNSMFINADTKNL